MNENEKTLELIETRRSVRKFKPGAVPKEILEKIVRAGTYAPSGMGWQSPIILAVTNKELRDELSKWCWPTRASPPISTTAAWSWGT